MLPRSFEIRKSHSYLYFLVSMSVLLASCGGSGGGSTTAPPQNSTPSPVLGIQFIQSGVSDTNAAGMQTVTLHNASLQIAVPDNGFSNIYIRTGTDNPASLPNPAGNVMARYFDESPTTYWYLAAVGSGDQSLNGFTFSETIASGSSRILNIKEIRDRFGTSKTGSTTLYLQFYVPTAAPGAAVNETIGVILN